MRRRVVFLFYHGVGHINPCLPLARMLEGEGHEVFFAGVQFFKTHITNEGFSFYPLRSIPFGLGFEKWVNTTEGKKLVYFSSLKDRITDRLYKRREADLLKMLDDLSPDVILLDGTQPTDFIVLYPQMKARAIPVALIHAMFPSHVVPGRPPVNSDALPEEKANVSAAIRHMKWNAARKAFVQKIKFLGFSDSYLIDRRLIINQVPGRYRSEAPGLFYFMPRITSCILAPREFDFLNFQSDPLHHYIGFAVNHSRNVTMSEEYLHRRIDIIRLKKTGRKVVYCSFGTIESEHQHAIRSFLRKLSRIASTEKLVLILSQSSQELPFDTGNDADSIYQFATVPQPDVLTYCDLFITHGGLSSIKESIDAEVPMLMYPVHSNFDPKGNSARVAYHGLGLRGAAATDTQTMIQNKIHELLNDPRFKINLKKMKEHNKTYSKSSFLDVFNSLRPLP